MTCRVNIKTPILLAVIAIPLLAGCENAKEELGLTRKAPDEFAVIQRAPLEMPPDYTLRPPQPGAARPQEEGAQDQAKQAVFGGKDTADKNDKPANSEEFLLQKTGADQTDPSIRTVVDQEAAATSTEDKPVAKKLLGLGGDDEKGEVIDPVAESERLRKGQQENEDVTEDKETDPENE